MLDIVKLSMQCDHKGLFHGNLDLLSKEFSCFRVAFLRLQGFVQVFLDRCNVGKFWNTCVDHHKEERHQTLAIFAKDHVRFFANLFETVKKYKERSINNAD